MRTKKKIASNDMSIFIGDCNIPVVGGWIDLPATEEEFNAVINIIKSDPECDNPEGEYIIADWQGLGNVGDITYASFERVNEYASVLDEYSYLPYEVIEYLSDLCGGLNPDEFESLADDCIVLSDVYSDSDLGYAIADELGGVEYLGNETLQMYFDYEAFGRDCKLDGYSLIDGGYAVYTANKKSKIKVFSKKSLKRVMSKHIAKAKINRSKGVVAKSDPIKQAFNAGYEAARRNRAASMKRTAENKGSFVSAINDALIKCGDGRYDYLRDKPLIYNDANETISFGNTKVNVAADSLTSIMYDIYRLFE